VASRQTALQWLEELTDLPTASGLEDRVVDWVERWVGRRSDLSLKVDTGGNLLITQKGRKKKAPVIAVAHMDHPAFVVTGVSGRVVHFEFRGGVNAEYFDEARVEFFAGERGITGVVDAYDAESQTGKIHANRDGVLVGEIARWKFARREPGDDRFLAPACDDLAGCAAALAALDRARGDSDRRHFGVLLTRAEEVGLVGAIHAARTGTLPADARILSIETSRTSVNAPIGEGPIIRVGDAVTIFDQDLTNRISHGASRAGVRHQRKLMDGGGCEASAFLVYGYKATGLCLALGNWHNRGNLDEFEAGTGEPVPMLEEISISDFHGLTDLLLVAADVADEETGLAKRFDDLYENVKAILDPFEADSLRSY
jgi:putative aminopeptidase FrvX